MTDIARREDAPLATASTPQAAARLVEWAQAAHSAHQLATALVSTAFVPQQYRGKAGEATAAILAGAELGLDPLASLRAFDNIQGTTAPKAITLRAIAQARGHDIEVREESDAAVTVQYRRRGGEWQTLTWTIEQAQRLGLAGKDNWKKQPRAMLVARATSEAARRVASDAILGIPYSAEELRDNPEPIQVPPAKRVTAAEILGKPDPVRTAPEEGVDGRPYPVDNPPVEDEPQIDWPAVAGVQQ
jgi:hypothetical protein